MLRPGFFVLAALLLVGLPGTARAQQPGSAPAACNLKWQVNSAIATGTTNENHYILIKNVEVDCNDMQMFADEAEIFSDADRVHATGNVLFVSQNNRISAERMDFNLRTKTGTFYVASGIASMENRGVDKSLFGNQEPDAYFWGETIEKLGPRTYRISRGGFTTCVQPTPRWELVAKTVTMTLEEHAVMRNALFKIKDVPVFYLPAMYYPINSKDRTTGFLMPIYGSSSLKGQSIENRFFWAIDRSQDATFEHDFYSKTGQGVGGEYEYIQAPGSQGKVDVSFLKEHEATYNLPDGSESTYPGGQSFTVHGNLIQAIGTHLRASAQANYFSSFVAQERYAADTFNATNTSRSYSGSLQGTYGPDTFGVSVNHTEYISDATDSTTTGSLPQFTFGRAETRIGKLPIYWGLSAEDITIIRKGQANGQVSDNGLTRLDLFPGLRFPFTKWPFLTFNSTLQFRETYWTQSLDPTTSAQVQEGINRHYFTMGTTITGPVFTRIFNTPKLHYAQKFKHVIEPVFTLSHVTAIPNAAQIVPNDGTDFVVGSVNSIQYGLNSRLYAKKDTAREIVTIQINQSYYSDANAAARDLAYQSSQFTTVTGTGLLPPTNFTPVAIIAHVTPTPSIDTTFRTEYNTQVHELTTLAWNGGFTHGWVSTSDGWSLQRYVPDLNGFNVLLADNHYLTSSTTVKKPGSSFGGVYSFNYDLRNHDYLNQRITGYYNSQCCGIIMEYQTFNYAGAVAVGIPQDHRFNISFSLAGIGTFSDLFGTFGQHR